MRVHGFCIDENTHECKTRHSFNLSDNSLLVTPIPESSPKAQFQKSDVIDLRHNVDDEIDEVYHQVFPTLSLSSDRRNLTLLVDLWKLNPPTAIELPSIASPDEFISNSSIFDDAFREGYLPFHRIGALHNDLYPCIVIGERYE
jgi:hypothetical protein